MERLLFRKIEIWILLLVVLLGVCVLIFLLWIVHTHEAGKTRFGFIERTAIRIAAMPTQLVAIVSKPPATQTSQNRFAGEGGFYGLENAHSIDERGFLLLSRFSVERNRYIVELVDLEHQHVLHSYAPDIASINARSMIDPHWLNLARDKSPERYRMVHPLSMADGGIIFQDGSPLVRIDRCSRVEWTIDGVFHHSIELDADGNIWVPSTLWPPTVPGVGPFFSDDAITKISPDGKILLQRSITKILTKNHMRSIIVGTFPYSDDPLHLNDIQPVITDGPFWKRGDIFISLRHRSMILLYRPSTDEIVWHKQGPWILQHDVDVISDHEISVFSNNALVNFGGDVVDGTNQEIVYDFATQKVSYPYRTGFQKNDIRTITEGRGTILPGGDIFVEETDYGRALRMDSEGRVRWRYISPGANNTNSILGWSRYVRHSEIQSTLDALKKEPCKKE